MFTGIVTALGTIRRVESDADRMRITIDAPYEGLEAGESVAVDGACLTVVEVLNGGFAVDAVVTTRGRTRFDDLREGETVNLERALAAGERLGGHFVQGHVDGVGRVERVKTTADARLIDISMPREIAEITVLHGSIAVNGVSMTVNALPSPGVLQLSVIPFTLEETNLGNLKEGDGVHLESDMIGKFVRQLMDTRSSQDIS